MRSGPKDCHNGNRWLKFFKKWHRWPGVIMGFFFILWAISGVVMNHRQLFSNFDITRNLVPKENRYVNWNNAAVRSGVMIGNDSLLLFGNTGIWLTDTRFAAFKDFNAGFPEGIDNRKISSMLVSSKGNVYAGTLFGLFYLDFDKEKWVKIPVKFKDERIQWIIEKEGRIVFLTRSEMFESVDNPASFNPVGLKLPPPAGYDNKTGLFRTIWVIHSGEIYGKIGRLVVDALGLVVILLAVTGSLHFAMPYALRTLKKRKKSLKLASATKKASATWHKKAGIWIAVFILINTITGMFLRPPLLIAIANARVGKIPFSVMDTPNPWEDKLRAVIWDEEIDGYILGTTEGLFFADNSLEREMVPLPGQPPLSVMGINVFQKTGSGQYLVGTFNGIYDWYLKRDGVPPDGVPGTRDPISFYPDGVSTFRDGVSFNHLSGRPPQPSNSNSKPFGDEMVSGYLKLENGNSVYFDYNKGAVSLGNEPVMPAMPLEIIEKSPMSWWNFALEVHTGRIFKPLVGDFYILIVPLLGIFGTVLIISGIIVWIKLYARKNR
ncbi:MAG TPA: PepSY domain-containing protein [Bacteroidales bacterium]|nr:PepSY domain-containing protein [Bacteroidales bacterium]HPM92064.1 PepSY domain-containing protein [Bacteroidales bacterium]